MSDETMTSETPRRRSRTLDPAIERAVHDLVARVGADPEAFEGRLVTEMVGTCLKLVPDQHDTGKLKLINSALKEMRYAYNVFAGYAGIRKVSIFGSARTPEDHPDYDSAREFSRQMAARGWMAITGAGDGIMKAGHEGPQRQASFGLSIRLPFETTANTVIDGDPKLINFRYFFTRKLMFLSHADAIAVFPGGFGTQDELFEALTLIQTGKSNMAPIVLLEGRGGAYWRHWEHYIRDHLLASGWISPEDPNLYHIAPSPEAACDHIRDFYRLYHSSRYVGDTFVIRLTQPLLDRHVDALNEEFEQIVAGGEMEQRTAFPEEDDHLDLSRLAFTYTRRHLGLLRAMIDRINSFATDLSGSEA